MPEKAYVISMIRDAFRETNHPSDAFLQGSTEGCEPGEAVAYAMNPALTSAHSVTCTHNMAS
jgi:hypothetical protein